MSLEDFLVISFADGRGAPVRAKGRIETNSFRFTFIVMSGLDAAKRFAHCLLNHREGM